MRKRLLTFFPLLLTVTLVPGTADADPLRVTGGAYVLDIEGDLFSFTGLDFSLTSTELLISPSKTFPPQCSQCSAGELVDWSFRTPGEQLLGRGDARIGSVDTSGVDFIGTLNFNATPTPFPSGDWQNVLFTAPFSFAGSIRGVKDGLELFSRDFNGRGRVSVNYEPGASPGLFTEDDDTIPYEFSASPVPEPGTLLLMGSGLGMALARARRLRGARGPLN